MLAALAEWRVADLHDVVRDCDAYLRVREIADYPNALNGLQLENSGCVAKIAAAVDFSTRALETAATLGANLLIVHHGMFWSGLRPVTNAWRRQLKLALDNDIAVYSVHLPLDVHPIIGNNVLLMRALGIGNSEPFFEEKNLLLGRRAHVDISLAELVQRLGKSVGGEVHCTAGGPDRCREIGVITGGGGGEVERVAGEGIDTFITGEAPHWAAIAAHELGVNLLLGGHYATETFGVKALAAYLAERFALEYEFLELPTRL
ncbi:MAG: Nif3-like dinuclear metal center hexameric protein [Verrucomicrobia bacterium]|nr:Nif3-like dinuclear metal center hexameric protein [Verrucomicrobiota bacterium]